MPEAEFEPARVLETLDRHGVENVLVGGLGARGHGATRPTSDIDLVPDGHDENLERLAAAFREMNARLRVGGMTDDEARQLPVQLDAQTLRSFGSSTWMTDAGPTDVLRDLRDRQGRDVAFDELIARGVDQQIGAVVVQSAYHDECLPLVVGCECTLLFEKFRECSRDPDSRFGSVLGSREEELGVIDFDQEASMTDDKRKPVRPRKWSSDAERMRAARAAKREKRLAEDERPPARCAEQDQANREQRASSPDGQSASTDSFEP